METVAQGKHETQWITISLDEYESMKATIETLSSREAMEKICRGEDELRAGSGRKIDIVKKRLGN
jgi:PHD/YefM family antitoxin component YafN of YafNO toxin-antitoxin module